MSERSLPATGLNIQKATAVIDNQRGGGGTELLQALQTALSLPRSEGYSRTVVIATDGYVTVEEQSFELIRKNLGEANMFAFGIGTSVNRHLIEGISFVGSGEPFIITRPEDAPAKVERFRNLIETPVLTNISVDFNGFNVYDMEPPSMGERLTKNLVSQSLLRAVETKRPAKGLLHHSDRGSQYCAHEYRKILDQFAMKASMSRKGNCYDNAPMESFWGTLKQELVYHRRYRSRQEAIQDITEYIEVFYNRQRRQKRLGYLSPAAYEQRFYAEKRAA